MNESRRLLSVDAVRGTAMLFVGISHISEYVQQYSLTDADRLRWLGYFATPAFLLMSGIASGYQLAGPAARMAAIRILDRGLFVLLVGHMLVSASLVYLVPRGTAYEHIVITDSIGLMLCTTPFLRHLSIKQLMLSGGAIVFVSSIASVAWEPASSFTAIVGALLFDIKGPTIPDAGWITATLPYLGIFVVGIGIGKVVKGNTIQERGRNLSWHLALAGATLIFAGVALNAIAHFAKPLLAADYPGSHWSYAFLAALDVRHKIPPGPAYVLFYGGLTVALVGVLGLLPERGHPLLMAPVRIAAVFGRASFVSYVVLQWLIDFVPGWAGFGDRLSLGLAWGYLTLVMLVTFQVARAWDARRANRYLTLGLRRLMSDDIPPNAPRTLQI